jgi:hypothetical protein
MFCSDGGKFKPTFRMAEAAGGPRSAGRNAKANAAAAFARNSSKATQAAVGVRVGELGIPSAGRNAANVKYLKDFGHNYKLMKLAATVDEAEECKVLSPEDLQLIKEVAAFVLEDKVDELIPDAEGGGKTRGRKAKGSKAKKSRRIKRALKKQRGGMRFLDAIKGFFRGLCGGVRGVAGGADERVAALLGDAEGQVNRANLLRTVQGLGVGVAVLGGGSNYFIDLAKSILEMILVKMPDTTVMLKNALGVIQGSLEVGGLVGQVTLRLLALYFIVKMVMIIQDFIRSANLSLWDLRKPEHRQSLKLELLRGLFKREPTVDELAQLGDMDAAVEAYIQERPVRPMAPMGIPPPLPRGANRLALLAGAPPLPGNAPAAAPLVAAGPLVAAAPLRLNALRNAPPLPGNEPAGAAAAAEVLNNGAGAGAVAAAAPVAAAGRGGRKRRREASPAAEAAEGLIQLGVPRGGRRRLQKTRRLPGKNRTA